MSAAELYDERRGRATAAVQPLRARERRLSYARLGCVAAAIAVAFIRAPLALLPAAAFIVLVFVHDGVVRRRRRGERVAAFYERGMARIEERWQGGGDGGDDLADEHHPYAGDFDLFGRGSLFELVSLAATRAGRARLAAWLKVPSLDAREIAARQEAVLELRERVDLREDLAVAAAEVAREVEAANLERWSTMPRITVAPWARAAMFVVPALATLALLATLPSAFGRLVGWTHPESALRLGIFADVPLWPLVVLLILEALLMRALAPRLAPAIEGVERAEPPLALLGGLLRRLERETFAAPLLASLASRIGGASEEIERLRKLVALLDARRNQFFAPIGFVLFWTPLLAMAVERWRERSGARIGGWIEAVGTFEALSSLASFAFEHPDFAMPSIVDDGPLFDAVALGHPLIAAQRRVVNDLRLDATLRLLVVSGSNMSGKSTMMRSAGIAAVLAMAGGPVCARALRIAPMAVGASIRIHDSLQENASRFYAEIVRIREVLELARRGPLLFLLDEVLAGTNSHDRRIGAEAIVGSLVDRGAIGLVSTHDLALARIAETLAPRAANVHFEDHLENGQVVFDYRMRPGVVTKSNALELMRSVGIEV
ncbi:MAG TPA: DNA mismatch repair protein MutS [Thermoanaerobaculia bacterium]